MNLTELVITYTRGKLTHEIDINPYGGEDATDVVFHLDALNAVSGTAKLSIYIDDGSDSPFILDVECASAPSGVGTLDEAHYQFESFETVSAAAAARLWLSAQLTEDYPEVTFADDDYDTFASDLGSAKIIVVGERELSVA